MSEPSDEDIARLRGAVVRISRELDRQAGSHGITRTQWSILASVNVRGPMGAGELAEREGVNPTMLSRTLTKLEEMGLIRRTASTEDRRAVRVEITAAGSRLQRKISAERTRLLGERLARLAPPELKALTDALPALEALVDEMAREAVRP